MNCSWSSAGQAEKAQAFSAALQAVPAQQGQGRCQLDPSQPPTSAPGDLSLWYLPVPTSPGAPRDTNTHTHTVRTGAGIDEDIQATHTHTSCAGNQGQIRGKRNVSEDERRRQTTGHTHTLKNHETRTEQHTHTLRAGTHTHTDTHTHNENRKQEQRKSGERKLLRSRRAALDVFRSVGREWQSAVLDIGFSADTGQSCPLTCSTRWVAPINRPRKTPMGGVLCS